jgi:hypothetical protein
MFHGFEKLDEGTGFLFTVLGEDDPGKVPWTPAAFEAAAGHGLKLIKGGRLIDTSSGEYGLKDVELEDVIGDAALSDLKTPTAEKLRRCVVAAADMATNPASPLASEGVAEAGVIVPHPTTTVSRRARCRAGGGTASTCAA